METEALLAWGLLAAVVCCVLGLAVCVVLRLLGGGDGGGGASSSAANTAGTGGNGAVAAAAAAAAAATANTVPGDTGSSGGGGGADAGGDAGGGGGGGAAPGPDASGEGGGVDAPADRRGVDVPTASAGGKQACRTYMADSNDDGSCFKLVYDHCIPGKNDPAKIPSYIRKQEQGVLAQAFAEGGASSFHGGKPTKFTRVCVADPAKAGKASCLQTKGGRMKAKDYRVHMRGFRPSNFGACEHKAKVVSYVKAHVSPDGKIYDGMLGNVGH